MELISEHEKFIRQSGFSLNIDEFLLFDIY